MLKIFFPEIGIPAEAAAGTARATLGESGFNRARNGAVMAYSLSNGILPVPPFLPLLPLKIAAVIVFTLILLFGFGITWWKSLLIAYAAQAALVTYVSYAGTLTALKLAVNV
jgi:hypothetical protein